MAQGHYYIGDFVENMAHGKGVFFNFNTGSVFVGEFYQNQFNGKGREWYGPLEDPELELQRRLKENLDTQDAEEVKDSQGLKSVSAKRNPKSKVDGSYEEEQHFDENQIWVSQHPDLKFATQLEVQYGLRKNKTIEYNHETRKVDDKFEKRMVKRDKAKHTLNDSKKFFGIQKVFEEFEKLNRNPDFDFQLFDATVRYMQDSDVLKSGSEAFVPATSYNIKTGEYREN